MTEVCVNRIDISDNTIADINAINTHLYHDT